MAELVMSDDAWFWIWLVLALHILAFGGWQAWKHRVWLKEAIGRLSKNGPR